MLTARSAVVAEEVVAVDSITSGAAVLFLSLVVILPAELEDENKPLHPSLSLKSWADGKRRGVLW